MRTHHRVNTGRRLTLEALGVESRRGVVARCGVVELVQLPSGQLGPEGWVRRTPVKWRAKRSHSPVSRTKNRRKQHARWRTCSANGEPGNALDLGRNHPPRVLTASDNRSRCAVNGAYAELGGRSRFILHPGGPAKLATTACYLGSGGFRQDRPAATSNSNALTVGVCQLQPRRVPPSCSALARAGRQVPALPARDTAKS
jgi:hypothetical protein